jgi:hypothetical protein
LDRRNNVTSLIPAPCFPAEDKYDNHYSLRRQIPCVGCRGLTRATDILCIEHPRLMRLSQELNQGPPALQANTLCKEPLMFLTAIQNLGLNYYSFPSSRDASSFELGIVAEFDSDVDIFDRRLGGPNSVRGSKELIPLLCAREQGPQTSECCIRIASRRVHH